MIEPLELGGDERQNLFCKLVDPLVVKFFLDLRRLGVTAPEFAGELLASGAISCHSSRASRQVTAGVIQMQLRDHIRRSTFPEPHAIEPQSLRQAVFVGLLPGG
jgi:hypothetical protein